MRAVRQRHPGRGAVLDRNLGHASVAAHGAALPGDQADHPGDQRARAAHDVMHAPAALEERNQCVDGAGRERVSADQQRMKAERLPQPWIGNVLGDQTMDGAVPFEPDQRRSHARHVGPMVERDGAELLETHAIDLGASGHEPVVAGDIGRAEACDLGPHGVGVARIVEDGAVVEADAVERRHRHDRHVVGNLAATQRP